MMVTKFYSLKTSQLFQHVATLIFGTALAQLVTLAFLPLLSRLYSANDFGILALYMAIASPLFILGNAGFRELIVLPRSNKAAAQIVHLIFFISIIIALTTLVIILLFGTQISVFLKNSELVSMLYLLPFSIFFFANAQSLRYWAIRTQNFTEISKGQVGKAITNTTTATGIKLAGYNLVTGVGLVVGNFLAEMTNALWLFFCCSRKKTVLLEPLQPKRLYTMAIRYKKMAVSLTISQIISTLYTQLPNIIISTSFGLGAVGLYAMAERIAAVPALLIASAVGDVYRQRASVLYREEGCFDRFMLKTLAILAAIAIIPYTTGIYFAPELFRFVLGAAWEQAGVYASIILVGSFFGFVTTPVDKASVIVGAYHFIFMFNLARLVLHILAALLVLYSYVDLMGYILVLTLIKIFVYLVITKRSFFYAQGGAKPS